MSLHQSPSGPIETERLADRVRRFAFEHYVSMARARGFVEVEIRAGDVHRAMGLANRMPAVCAALGRLQRMPSTDTQATDSPNGRSGQEASAHSLRWAAPDPCRLQR